MENELRYYLKQIAEAMKGSEETPAFKPTYMVTAVKLRNGAIELAINNDKFQEKIEAILENYNDNMELRGDADVVMQNIMIV